MTDDQIANLADATWEQLRVAMAAPDVDRDAMAAAAMSFALDLIVADHGAAAAQRYLRAAADELHVDYRLPTHHGGTA